MSSIGAYLVRLILLAGAYYLTGRLGLLLTIPPGQATAIWPASGIALAGLISFGPRYVSAVVLGALGTSLVHPDVIDLQALGIASTIALGAGAQALAGYWLVRRFLSLPALLEQPAEIFALLLLGGPVSCLVNATVGTLTLFWVGFVPAPALTFHWLTWWAGDVMGVFTFAPIMVLLLSPAGQIPNRRKRTVGISLSLTFCLVIYLFYVAKVSEQHSEQLHFDKQAAEIGQSLLADLDRYMDVLVAVERFVMSSSETTATKFESFTSSFVHRFAGIQSLSWNQRVAGGDLEDFEYSIRTQGYPNFAVRYRPLPGQMEPVSPSAVHFPVTYLAPYERNEAAHGLDTYAVDAFSRNLRQLTLDRARDEGRAIATGRIALVQAEGAYGLLVYRPVYDAEVESLSFDERKASLIGYAAGVFTIPKMIQQIAASAAQSHMHLTLHDVTDEGRMLLYDSRTLDFRESQPPILVSDETLTSRHALQFAGSQWELLLIEDTALQGQPNWSLWAVLVGGLLFTGLVGVFLLVVTARTEIVQRMVDRRTGELERALADAEELSRVKGEFLANMSHELRTPMNAIIGLTELTLDTEMTPLQQEYLTGVKDSSVALLGILNDILDLSKVEAGKMSLDNAIFDFRDSFDNILQIFSFRAQEKGLTFHADVEPDVPERLIGDQGRLRQVLVNLIGNAIKFTEKGEVSIRVGVDHRTAQQVELSVMVRDTGIGIPQDKQAQIFEAFSQADSSMTRRFGGTGLGLSISSELARMMEGSISLESNENQGSTFHFKARLGFVDERESTTEPAAREGMRAQASDRRDDRRDGPWRLLLAEDNPLNRRVAEALLKSQGHDVEAVVDGEQAVERTAQEKFDAVVMDIQMPKMDGLEATRKIREREGSSDTYLPIVGLTAHAMKGDRERFMAEGMDDCVTKPIDRERLLTALRDCISASNQRSES